MLRNSGEVDVVRVYRTEEAARAEVYRRRADDASEDHLHYYEETEIERAD